MIDRYTKIVLTVIALCLAMLVGQNFAKSAGAQGQLHVIVDQFGIDPVSLPLPVRTR